jgi:hypothetical protein
MTSVDTVELTATGCIEKLWLLSPLRAEVTEPTFKPPEECRNA